MAKFDSRAAARAALRDRRNARARVTAPGAASTVAPATLRASAATRGNDAGASRASTPEAARKAARSCGDLATRVRARSASSWQTASPLPAGASRTAAYAHFADDTSRKAAARLAGARLCVRVCVDPQVLARAAAADKKKDQELETSRCTTFHLLPLAALQASKADIKRVFRSRAEVSALLNGTQADGFPDDASLPVS